MKCPPTSLVSLDIFPALKYGANLADNIPDGTNKGGHMNSIPDKKFYKQTSFIVLTVSAFLVVATCAYSGFNISGISGAAFGAFVGPQCCAGPLDDSHGQGRFTH